MRLEGDGATLRQHLQRAAEATGRADPRLFNVCPKGGEGVWQAYRQLARTRPASFGGVATVPLSEIEAWQRLYGVTLTAWELDTIIDMDAAFCSVLVKKGSK